jgi:hypothetical protein
MWNGLLVDFVRKNCQQIINHVTLLLFVTLQIYVTDYRQGFIFGKLIVQPYFCLGLSRKPNHIGLNFKKPKV